MMVKVWKYPPVLFIPAGTKAERRGEERRGEERRGEERRGEERRGEERRGEERGGEGRGGEGRVGGGGGGEGKGKNIVRQESKQGISQETHKVKRETHKKGMCCY
ncbi:unnamed protein product [Bubo scandiacus]